MPLPSMNSQPPIQMPDDAQKMHWMDRFLAFFEVCGAALAGNLMAQLGLSLAGLDLTRALEDTSTLFVFLGTEAVFTSILILLFLRARGESLATIGWGRGSLRKETLLGLACIPALLLALGAVTALFHFFFPQYVTETNPILDLLQEPSDLALFLVSSIFVGGFKEEVQRAFALNRFQRFLGGGWFGLIMWSAFFGLGHVAQGVDNAFKAGALGLIFGILYLRRNSLTAPIVCHAVYDVVAVLLYWFLVR